jgi:hypothetical protein
MGDIDVEEIRTAIADEGPETPEVEIPEEEPDETTETEQPTEPEEEEPKEPEPEKENLIPQAEFDRRYAGWKTKEREYQEKIDLLQRDPNAYYAKYPNERPATPQAPVPSEVPTFQQCLTAPITDGPYKGYKLGDLWGSDDPQVRAAAVDIYNNYRDVVQGQINERQTQTKTKEEQLQSQVQEEHDTFYKERAQELFGKDTAALTEDEKGKISQLVEDLLDQMESLGVYRLESAYKLATLDERLRTAQGQSIKAVIDSIRKGSHTSTEAKKTGTGSADVYERMSDLNEEELARKLEKLSEQEQETFWKKAPKEFRNKFRAAADAWV